MWKQKLHYDFRTLSVRAGQTGVPSLGGSTKIDTVTVAVSEASAALISREYTRVVLYESAIAEKQNPKVEVVSKAMKHVIFSIS